MQYKLRYCVHSFYITLHVLTLHHGNKFKVKQCAKNFSHAISFSPVDLQPNRYMHDFKASPLKFHCLSRANKICEPAGNKKGRIIYIYPCSKGNLREFKATHALLSFVEMTSAAHFFFAGALLNFWFWRVLQPLTSPLPKIAARQAHLANCISPERNAEYTFIRVGAVHLQVAVDMWRDNHNSRGVLVRQQQKQQQQCRKTIGGGGLCGGGGRPRPTRRRDDAQANYFRCCTKGTLMDASD